MFCVPDPWWHSKWNQKPTKAQTRSPPVMIRTFFTLIYIPAQSHISSIYKMHSRLLMLRVVDVTVNNRIVVHHSHPFQPSIFGQRPIPTQTVNSPAVLNLPSAVRKEHMWYYTGTVHRAFLTLRQTKTTLSPWLYSKHWYSSYSKFITLHSP